MKSEIMYFNVFNIFFKIYCNDTSIHKTLNLMYVKL